jgi:hypothetical protein
MEAIEIIKKFTSFFHIRRADGEHDVCAPEEIQETDGIFTVERKAPPAHLEMGGSGWVAPSWATPDTEVSRG